MSFAVAADAYDKFMGRYSVPLAPPFADFAGITDGEKVLDVGCGPGALTAELADRLGASAVTAADPSESFVDALRERHPDVTALQASAEDLPFPNDTFDATLAQLVVHFMNEPVAGLGEMGRVTRSGGVVAASVWDHGGGQGPLSIYWQAARELDPGVSDESQLAGANEGDLTELFEAAGLHEIEEVPLMVRVEHESFEEWWEPYTLGVGPAGAYVAGLDDERREQLRARCAELVQGTVRARIASLVGSRTGLAFLGRDALLRERSLDARVDLVSQRLHARRNVVDARGRLVWRGPRGVRTPELLLELAQDLLLNRPESRSPKSLPGSGGVLGAGGSAGPGTAASAVSVVGRGLETLDRDLEDALGLVDAAQMPLPQREHGDSVRQAGTEQRTGGLGQEDLPAAPDGADARGTHDVETDVPLLVHRRLAGVEPDPHSNRRLSPARSRPRDHAAPRPQPPPRLGRAKRRRRTRHPGCPSRCRPKQRRRRGRSAGARSRARRTRHRGA